VFTQDDLITTEGFLKEAERRGHRLTLELLAELHGIGLLKPLYRVSDSAVLGRKIETAGLGEMNTRGWVFEAARDGRLREVADEGRSVWEPYQRRLTSLITVGGTGSGFPPASHCRGQSQP